MFIKRVFKYIEPIWLGEDGKISLKAIIAIVLTYKLLENVDYAIQKWDSGRSLGDVSTIFFTLAGLIAALLGITAWSNMTAKRIDTEAMMPPPSPSITVQKAETVTSGSNTTQAETVNAVKVDTVNTNTTNIQEPIDAK